MQHRKSVNAGRATFIVIALITLATAIGVVGFIVWTAMQYDANVSAYVKIHRSPAWEVFQEPPSLTDYRHTRNNHKTLMTSPMVIAAALQSQAIADLDIVRRQKEPDQWLMDELEISFPGDGEILQLSLACDDEDAEAAIRLVDGVINAYQDKVLLVERLEEASLQTDLKFLISEMDEELKADLSKLYTVSDGGDSPGEKAQAVILKDDCRARREVCLALKAEERQLGLQIKLRERAERHGHSGRAQVEVVQRAAIDRD